MGDVRIKKQGKPVLPEGTKYYKVPESKKRTVKEQVNISFANADPKKTVEQKYESGGSSTTYYDSDGKKLGSVFTFCYNDKDGKAKKLTQVVTPKVIYTDSDNNGTLDKEERNYTLDSKEVDDMIKNLNKPDPAKAKSKGSSIDIKS